LQDGLNLQIKWPNDIYYNGLKVGGALIHSTWTSAKFCVLTGIGLNVSNSQPTTCLNDIIAQQHKQQQQQQQFHHSTADALPADGVSSGRVNNEQLLACVLGHLERCFDQFEQHGFEPLRALYISNWMHSDQVVQLQEDGTAGGAVELTIKGLSPHGFLLAVDSCGQRYELTPDGNSLDMMQGLLKKKLY
jgi:biotin--protein ligase